MLILSSYHIIMCNELRYEIHIMVIHIMIIQILVFIARIYE